ncbi:hypothetical protein C0J50_13181 [Silurus asotus]|uniref:Ig-like domain-containing protein n=1 Tax=Silurus asotus TaxID=30991 RepID=A0AAD5B216_SILAS|nr:hypothetical protein C0J50_13181 [Silurus asotus]
MTQLYTLLYIVRYTPLILTVVTAGSFADKIGPTDADANKKETETVTLKCSYETNNEMIWFYWYKQKPNSAPQFSLYKDAGLWEGSGSTPTDTRLEAETNRYTTELTIRGLKLSDSALYHCALHVGYTVLKPASISIMLLFLLFLLVLLLFGGPTLGTRNPIPPPPEVGGKPKVP